MADAPSGGKEGSDLAAGCAAARVAVVTLGRIYRVKLMRPSTGPTPFGTGMSVDE